MTPHEPPPPGWYTGPDGTLRWWDGSNWGPAAPEQTLVESGRTLVILAHLGGLVGSFLVPLIVRLTEGKRNAFACHHSTEAENFHLTFAIAWVLGCGAFIGLAVSSDVPRGRPYAPPPVPVLAVFGVVMALYLTTFVCSIPGAVRASQGRWWRSPVAIRFVRGARRPESSADPAANAVAH